MKIIIHRGTHQIGGCITEIKTDKTRIFIDMGEELPDKSKVKNEINITGVMSGLVDCDAVFFTHYHGDHIGLISRISPNIPLYLGEASKEIFITLQKRLNLPDIDCLNKILTYKVSKPIMINDIKITPLMVDHSAYDSYMLLIESNGKKILHTGDFRNHGFKGKGLFPTFKKYVKEVDILITEGTNLSKDDGKALTEQELSLVAKKYLDENKYVYVVCSSTNIDRISAFYSVNARGKYFICDDYQKDVLNIVEKYGKKYSDLYEYKKALTYGSNLDDKLRSNGFCMLVRNNSSFKNIMNKFDKKESLIIYSMWRGYLDQEETGLKDFINGYEYIYLHTSGHASKETLLEVCRIANPKIGIIPIHGNSPELFGKEQLNSKIILLDDNQEFYI